MRFHAEQSGSERDSPSPECDECASHRSEEREQSKRPSKLDCEFMPPDHEAPPVALCGLSFEVVQGTVPIRHCKFEARW